MSPFFSIIIPVYNGEDYILSVLNSISIQTFTDFELIIYDDLSTDNSVNFVKNWLSTNKLKSKFIISKKNNGAAYGLNKCLKNSKGTYIVFGAHDNVFHPKRLETIYSKVTKNPNIKFLSHDIYSGSLGSYKKNEGKKEVGLAKYLKFNITNVLLFRSTLFSFDSIIAKKSLLKNYAKFINYSPVEDFALILDMLPMESNNYIHLSCPLMYKIISSKSQTHSHSEIINKKAIKLMQEQLIKNNITLIAAESISQISIIRNEKILGIRNISKNPLLFLSGLLINFIRITYSFFFSRNVKISKQVFK